MSHYHNFPAQPISPGSIVTIGVFDGMHYGHVQLLRSLATSAHANGKHAIVVTFDPHPDSVIHPERHLGLLISHADRIERISACGIDHVITVPFTPTIQTMSAREFMHHVVQATHIDTLWVGWDFALGRQREGNIEQLTAIGQELGYTTYSVPRIGDPEHAPSANSIRHALQDGDIAKVTAQLGRPHQYVGVVANGDQRGRTIGFPTANMIIDEHLMLPKFGVYACTINVGGECFVSVTNIGQRPTFHGVLPRIEAHILDFQRDIYAQQVELSLHMFIRPEQRFNGIQELITQIQRDVAFTRSLDLHEYCN